MSAANSNIQWRYAGPLYIPGANGPYREGIAGGSFDWDVGPTCEWDARCFARMGVANWTRGENQFWRSCGLYAAHLPFTQMARSAYPRKALVGNNGPTNFNGAIGTLHGGIGHQYPGLGPSDPNMYVQSEHQFGDLKMPANAATNNSFPYGGWHLAPFKQFGTSALTSDHWPITALFQYMMFGKRYFLDQLRFLAAHQVICNNNTGDGVHTYSQQLPVAGYPGAGGGTLTFYAKGFVKVQERDDMGMIPVAAAGYVGNATDPEIRYFQDVLDSGYRFWDYYYNTWMAQGDTNADPGIKTTGWWTWGRVSDPWMMCGYGGIAYALCRSISRHPLAHVPCDAQATLAGILWCRLTEVPLFFVPAYTYACKGTDFAPTAPPGGHGLGSASYPTTHEIGPGYDGLNVDTAGLWTYSFGGGTGNSHIPAAQDGVSTPVQNGDKVMVVEASPFNTTYAGPSGYDGNTTYYVCQNDAKKPSFRLTPKFNDPEGANAVTRTSPQTNAFLMFRMRYDPPVGNSCQLSNSSPQSSYSFFRGAMRELARMPLTPSNPEVNFSKALANVEAWKSPALNYAPIGAGVNAGFRWNISNTVRVV
jgi:hypothetical protein